MKEDQNSVLIFERAALLLAEANTVQKAKELKSMALTAAEWARRKGMGDAAVLHCRSYALDAERKMGEMLKTTERADGGTAQRTRLHAVTESSKPTLADIGVTKRESADAQKLADMPKADFEAVKAGTKTKVQAVREMTRAAVIQKVAALPSDKFRVIYADPPWKYGDTGDGLKERPGATAHYPTMTITELCALPIADIAEANAVLFLWVTSPLLFECAPLITAWGFKYKTSFVWDKVGHNMGHYNSVRHELLLVCTRGSCVPDVPKLFDSVQSIPKSRKHSEKPEEFRKIIETLYPHGKRIELFARGKKAGWERFGNEC